MISRPQSGQENGDNVGPKNTRFASTSLIYESNAPRMTQVDIDGVSLRTRSFVAEDGKVIHSNRWRY